MQISTGFRSCSPSPAPWPASQPRPAEAAPADKARWFVEHYPKLTQLSNECIDSQGRHLCLWQGPAGLLATVYDSRHQTFQTFSGSQIRNGLHPQEPSPRLQARLTSAPGIRWNLVLLTT